MRPRLVPILLTVAVLAGCSDYRRVERPPWRAQAEAACLARGLVRESASVRPFHAMNGPGICGAEHPFRVTALDGGTVALNATQTLDCPMIAALDDWVREVVQPAAEARFGERVVEIDSMGSYNCRGINDRNGANLSEHAFANAIDIAGFTLASGRRLNIMRGFNGADEGERAFLHEAHAGACGHFTTVLGPGYNIFHYNHFHMDLALHGTAGREPRRYCKPVPQPNLPAPPARDAAPDPPAAEEEMDVARAPIPEPAPLSGPPALMAALPPPPPPPRPPAPRPAATAPAPAPDAMPLISFGGPDGEGGDAAPRRPSAPMSAKDRDVTSSIGER